MISRPELWLELPTPGTDRAQTDQKPTQFLRELHDQGNHRSGLKNSVEPLN